MISPILVGACVELSGEGVPLQGLLREAAPE